MEKEFRLLKDLPELKAGAIFKWDNLSLRYRIRNGKYFYTEAEIQANPDWFEEVKGTFDTVGFIVGVIKSCKVSLHEIITAYNAQSSAEKEYQP